MFSGHSRCLARRVICPVVRGNEIALSSEFERGNPGGSNQDGKDDKKNPRSDFNYCPFLLTKNLFEYIGVTGICFWSLYKAQNDIRSRQLKDQFISEESGYAKSWQNFKICRTLIRPLTSRVLDSTFANVLPKSSTTLSTRKLEKEEQDFEKVSGDAPNFYNNAIGVALLQAGHIKDGIKFLEQCRDYGRSYYNLGVAYETGHANDGKPDYDKASSYYRKGVDVNHKWSALNLGLLVLNGKGSIQQDFEEGKKLLEKAKSLGLTQAEEYIKLLEDSRITKASQQLLKPLHSSSSVPDMKHFWGQEHNSCDPYNGSLLVK